MRKRMLSLLCVLALCLGLLPVTALAAGEDVPSTLYVGGTTITSGGYWITSDGGTTWTYQSSMPSEGGYIHYDGNGTLTLHNATITVTNSSSGSSGAGIYAAGSANSDVALTIVLEGNSTISGNPGIYILADQRSGGAASLTIEGNYGLSVTGTNTYGIVVNGREGYTSLTIKNATVTASTPAAHVAGVCVQSYSTNSTLSVAVTSGSLTASGNENSSSGIEFVNSSSGGTLGTKLTVSDSAVVKANNGITCSAASKPTPSGTGIVFDGTEGTVYGSVTLQDNLEIKSGESLTIPEGSSLDMGGNEITVASGGKLEGTPTGEGTVKIAPTITTESLLDGTVDTAYSQTLAATGDATITWSLASGSTLPAGLTLGTSTGIISGTPTAADTYNFTVTATNGAGSDSKAFTLKVTANTEPTTYTISTAEQLRNFANAVNGGNTTANAVLTADITLTGGDWTPIGKENACMYNGTFDGQGHTISGLQCSVTSGDFAGLFGVIGSSGVVKNVGIADSDVAVSTSDVAVSTTGQFAYAGGVCGLNQGGTITNCWNSGSVSASVSGSGTAAANQAYAGGVCGLNQEGTITNCWNSGSVSASVSGTATANQAYAGGVCGMNNKDNNASTVIQNCWNSGSVSANSSSSTAYAGGVCGDNTGSIDNSYWLNTACSTGVGTGRPTTGPDVESKTADEFASGEVAWLLNQGQTGTPWGQGSNGMPVLEGNLPAGVTSYVPVRITIVMTDNTQKSYYSAKGSTFTEYPTGYAFVFKDGDTKTWINKGTQTYDADATIYAENMTLEKIPAKAPTCTEAGNSEYWYCAAFDKYFKDENGVNEITAASTVLPATGHNLTNIPAKEPTSTQAGNIEYWSCSKCGKYFSDENGENEITYESTVIPATGHSSGGSSSSTKTPSQQAINKIESAKDGSTVEINLSTGSTKLDKEVFEELSGKDVTLEISVPGGVTWTVNGQDIPDDADLTDLDLGVSMNTSTIPVDIINTVTGEIGTVQLALKHDGEFGFTMTLSAPLGTENKGLWANLYYYNEDSRELEFQAADKIASDVTASFPFSHASDYAIVIDTDSHEPVELPFTDVPEDAWYADAAGYVYKHGLMAGTSATTFAPDVTTSRAMIATILWRMAGSPVVDYAMSYTDVAQGQWYSEAVRWATSEGVVTGYGNGLFGTNDPITREQLATMLWRYAQTEGYDVSIGEDTNILSYTDVADLAEYAISAMQWACGAGVINGTGDGSTLTPQGQATRAQAAVMLMRFCEEYVVW